MSWSKLKQIWAATLLLCVSQSYVLAINPAFLGDWVDSVEKATSHNHWEHIVKRQTYYARYNNDNSKDDTDHIVNVKDYYRSVFSQGWSNYISHNDKEFFDLLNTLDKVIQQNKHSDDKQVNAQDSKAGHSVFGTHTKRIKGRYIVMFQENADDYTLYRTIVVLQKANRVSNKRIRASDIYPLRYIGKGFTATLNRKALALMAKHPLLGHIEEDVALRRSDITTHEETEAIITSSVPWNLDRLDQRSNILDQSYSPSGDGSNVDIYIIDTGVRASHQEFGDRVHYAGFDAIDALTGTEDRGRDCNGHGTHCAGTAAGTTYGVAKNANIYNLRALNCEGTGAVSGIVMGIDKIIQSHLEHTTGRPKVISQSLGVKTSQSLNGAIQRAVAAGITAVGAAGNQASYSCNFSPPSARVGISVGATDKNDEVTIFTNTGECTDIMAPGSRITSASNRCDTCTKTMSGTSMATPHGAGYAAIVLSQNPRLTATEVKEMMISDSTKGRVMMSSIASSRSHETPNRLLYVKSTSASEEHNNDIASIQGYSSRP